MTVKDRTTQSTGEDAEASSPGRVDEALDQLRAAQVYAAHYVAAQLDRVKLIARNLAVISALAIVSLLAVVTVVVTAVVLLCLGIAGAIGHLFGGTPWIGDLVTGLLILGSIAIGIKVVVSGMTGVSRRHVTEAYEKRRARQRSEFGADVHDRSEN
jgi:hypothetical protein